MADLQDDRKKEEEEYGGFEPEENDDESFMLEDENEYPAKLPDNFSDESSPKVSAVSPKNDDKSEKVEEEKEATELSEESDDKPESNDPVESHTPEVEQSESESRQSDEESIQIEDSESQEIPEPENLDSSIELDDDFKQRVQEDLDKSKAKREAKEDLESQRQESAKQIGEDADTVVMLSDIDADKPSNFNENVDEVDQMSIEGHIAENIEGDSTDVPEEVEGDKEGKKRKTPVWIMMLYSAVATFLVTSVAMLLIWSMMTDSGGDIPPEEPHKTDVASEVKQSQNQAQHPITDSISLEEKNWLDSMDMDKEDTLLRSKEDKEFFSDLIDGDDFDELDEKPIKPKKDSHKKATPKKKEEHKKPIKPKKSESEDIASKDVTSSPKSNANQNTTKIDESKFSMPQPKGPVPEIGTFTVQIYSSPSREDAENWLGQLKAQQVPNAKITEQEIKGRTWYRVRYGAFETKEQARASALELGYSQSWIDRIK